MADLFNDVNMIETTQITPEGRIQKVFRVSARTKSGVYYTVDIPESDMTPNRARDLLTQRAQQIESIKGL